MSLPRKTAPGTWLQFYRFFPSNNRCCLMHCNRIRSYVFIFTTHPRPGLLYRIFCHAPTPSALEGSPNSEINLIYKHTIRRYKTLQNLKDTYDRGHKVVTSPKGGSPCQLRGYQLRHRRELDDHRLRQRALPQHEEISIPPTRLLVCRPPMGRQPQQSLPLAI